MVIYNLFIWLYKLAMRLVALWHPKAAEWIAGRKDLFDALSSKLPQNDDIIWMHCASAGEFEQGKPVLEALKKQYPGHKIAVSFFSPSGYKVGLKYKGADLITYLPLDTAANADRFVALLNPKLVIFVKYDYWYHHLKAVADRSVPLLLVSAIYRDSQVFFKSYGGFYRKLLHLFTHIFLQDQDSVNRLKRIGVNHCSISGDTRFDRVAAIVGEANKVDFIQDFIGNVPTIVAGSTWPDDEKLFADMGADLTYKLIVAPHEISQNNIGHLLTLFGNNAITYSTLQSSSHQTSNYTVLIIDNIGMLSRLYQYATFTYIGGGFNKSGIHNTLEAAAWGKPVIFGPNYQKFREARELILAGAAFSVSTTVELRTVITTLSQPEELTRSSVAAKEYVQHNGGATQTILSHIQENRLLTTP